MIEWYRVDEGLGAIQRDCQNFVQDCAKILGLNHIEGCDLMGEWGQISVYKSFKKYAKINIEPAFLDPENPSLEHFQRFASKVGCAYSKTDRWDDIFFKIFMDRIEPHLGFERPIFLTDYPVSMAALACKNPANPSLCERFELYINGIELANAFGELTDPIEQKKRFEADLLLKKQLYGDAYPIDEDFIEALEFGLPESSGIALGIDRLVMLLTGANHIDDVNFL